MPFRMYNRILCKKECTVSAPIERHKVHFIKIAAFLDKKLVKMTTASRLKILKINRMPALYKRRFGRFSTKLLYLNYGFSWGS